MLVVLATNVLHDVHLYITSACPVILIHYTFNTHIHRVHGGGGVG